MRAPDSSHPPSRRPWHPRRWSAQDLEVRLDAARSALLAIALYVALARHVVARHVVLERHAVPGWHDDRRALYAVLEWLAAPPLHVRRQDAVLERHAVLERLAALQQHADLGQQDAILERHAVLERLVALQQPHVVVERHAALEHAV